MARRRITYRPGKTQGAFGAVWGGIFVLIGLFVVIPAFGPFGILWTLGAAAITAMNVYQSFGKKYRGPEIHIEEEETPPPSPARGVETHDHIPSTALDARGRLEQLEALKGAGLLTEEEYREKRKDILDDL